eukprot:SAG31_NODE_994_length_10499_cov_6.293452_1_plen_78_part_00
MEAQDASASGTAVECADAVGGHHKVLWAGGIGATSLLFAVIVVFTLTWEFTAEKLDRLAGNPSACQDQFGRLLCSLL